MPARRSFEYALVRVVPRVERGEFLNAGVILWCKAENWLGARVALDRARLAALAPEADVALIESHLASLEKVARGSEDSGPIGRLSPRERFAWLVAPRSTAIQVSEVHEGLCENPENALEHLVNSLVQPAAGTPAPETRP